MSGVSHALSKKAIKKLNLEENPKFEIENKEIVQEWPDQKTYWEDFTNEILNRDKKWYTKIKNFFVYRIGWRCRDLYYNTKWYFHNLKVFQPVLKTWRSFDYHYQVDLFKFGIQQLANAMEYYGSEETTSRVKRIEAINKLIREIERDYEEDVRERLNYDFQDAAKVVKFSDGSVMFENDVREERRKETENYFAEIKKERKAHYQKIFDLIIGQDNDELAEKIQKRLAEIPAEEKENVDESELYNKVYYELWDGSGIEGWWD